MIFSRLPRSAPVMAAMCVLAALAVAQGRSATHIVPFFPAASDTRPQGLVRIVNLADEPGTLDVVAIDAAGARFEGVSLALGAGETAHFDSDDLESGNADAGLTGATGRGQGDWRLELNSTLDLEVQAYVRTREGELAEMYETAAGAGDRFRIATFNPGSNVNQVGLLWLFNRGDEPVAVTVQGTDDLGQSPGPGVSIDLPAREARTYTAAELESGAAPGLSGSLGDGAGKWRLDGEASGQVLAMSLTSSPTGHLTNLSTLPSSVSDGVHRVPLFPPASDTLGRQGFVRVINRSDTAGEVRIEAFDETEWAYEALTLTLEAGETRHFNSNDLELGNAAKGLTGSTGAGDGDWRLELTSELDLEVLSYVRTVGGQGYVTPMHDTAAREAEGLMRYYVPIFHAAEYEAQESRLHLFNPGEAEARVGIDGLDDAGAAASEGDVSLVLQPGATRVITAAELESGGDGLDGRFGAGEGRWRLYVSSDGALQVMSLGYSKDGFLANLSRGSPPAFAAPVAAPDLVVEAPMVDDGSPDAGGTFALSATVTNRGDGDAEATTLRYYRSTNANISRSDTEVGTAAVNALSTSGSGDETINLSAPSEAGTYYYGACADPVAGESDIANNCSAAVRVAVTARPRRPDLVVESLSVSGGSLEGGGAFTLSATVRNRGDGDAGATTLRYYRSSNAVISTSDVEVGSDPVDVLPASGSSSESIALNAPDDPGTYYFGACADAVSGESDTANNCSAGRPVTVSEPVPSDPPDLVVSAEVDNETPDAAAEFELTAAVRNVGDQASAATMLHYYKSTDTIISPSDIRLDGRPVDALDADGMSTGSITRKVPTTAGTEYYGACVDAVPDESDTTNNCSAAIPVTPQKLGPPDLVVAVSAGSDLSEELAPYQSLDLDATVTNVGDGPSAGTTLRYYWSTDDAITPADTQLEVDAVSTLPAAGRSAQSAAVTVPSEPGTLYFGACVDAVPNESDTTNNCSSALAATVSPPAGPPDLHVGSPSSWCTIHVSNDTAFLQGFVRNIGEGTSPPSTMRFYLHRGDASAKWQVATRTVQSAPPFKLQVFNISVDVPNTSGRYTLNVCVDVVEGETNTANNCYGKFAFEVVQADPLDDLDLTIPEGCPLEAEICLSVVKRGQSQRQRHTRYQGEERPGLRHVSRIRGNSTA